jgi:peptide/nickel transport system permease protein
VSSVAQLEAAEPPTEDGRPTGRRPLGIVFWCASTWLVIVGSAAIFAPYLPIKNPTNQDYTNGSNYGVDQPPSWHHLLGTDQLARDILSRLIFGSRVSLTIALLATLISIGIGSSIAMLSAYRQSRASGLISSLLDNALVTFMYSLLSFPAIIAVLAILAFWGTTETHLWIVIGAAGVPLIFRLVRSATLSVATREYVTAARAQGATAFRVIFREILPNIAPTLIAYTVFTIGAVVGTEGALGFIGLSVAPPTPTWGNMFNDASGDPNNLSLVLAPTIVLFLTLVALNTAGERIRLHFDTAEGKL